jgi:hypothetical protein
MAMRLVNSKSSSVHWNVGLFGCLATKHRFMHCTAYGLPATTTQTGRRETSWEVFDTTYSSHARYKSISDYLSSFSLSSDVKGWDRVTRGITDTRENGENNRAVRNQALSKWSPSAPSILNPVSSVSDRKTTLHAAKMKSQILRMRAKKVRAPL